MEYYFFRPSVFLAPYVDYYFVVEAPKGALAVPGLTTFPIPHGQMVFSWGDASHEQWLGEAARKSPDFAVCGYTTKAVTYQSQGALGVLMIGFKPWGIQPFLDFELKELTNANSEMSLHFGRQTTFLEEQLRAAASLEERIRIVETFLAGRLRRTATDQAVEHAVGLIARTGGAMRVDQLAGACYLSKRQFLRRFEASIGISPKSFSRIVRFQQAFARIQAATAGGPPDWTDIAYCAEYADQAHYIHEFREFTGFTPAEFYQNVQRSQAGSFFENQVKDADLYRTIYL